MKVLVEGAHQARRYVVGDGPNGGDDDPRACGQEGVREAGTDRIVAGRSLRAVAGREDDEARR